MGMRFKRLSNTWNKGVRSVDWWLSGGISAVNCIAAYQAKGAASYAASKVNLANPGTYNATEGTAPDWDVTNGWKFDNSDYLDTGIVPSNHYSAIIRISNAAVENTSGFGLVDNNPSNCYFCIYDHFGAGMRVLYGNQAPSGGSSQTSGVLAITEDGLYAGGSKVITISSYTWAGTDLSIYIGCRNNNGSNDTTHDVYFQAVAVYDINISSYISDLTTAMLAL